MLNYKIYGEGEPIIILHGLFGMLDNWRTFARKMEADYQLILVDQRNHGKSFHSDDFNYHLLAEDLHEFIHELGLDRFHLMGHSMGGKSAIEFTRHYYNHVNKLIVVDIAPKQYPRGHDTIFNAVLSMDIENLSSRSEADEVMAASIHHFAIRQFLLKNLSRNPQGGYRWKANFQSLCDNYEDIMTAIDIQYPISTPTLFVRGTKSGYITEEDKNVLSRQFSDHQIGDIDAGHWVHAERPEELEALVRRFLTS